MTVEVQAVQGSPGDKAYWVIQMALVVMLKQAGIYVDVRQRIEPFKMKRKISKLKCNEELKEAIYSALGGMVKLRQLGVEPTHKRGMYI